jgi:phosphoglycerol transferase MdoB-like AlkP superfamily enzyme
LNGLVSTLCSYYLPNHSESWYLGHNDFTRLYCLPRFLRGRGYHSQFNLVVERSYLQMGWLLENLGFDRVLDVADISAGLKQPPLSWGMSDHQMFRYLADNLAAGAYAPPFFVSFVTIDSHAPFNLAKDLAPSNETSPLLRTITSTDDAFGEFWRYFRSSPYFGNTMLVVLGDHQMFPGQQAAEAAREADATTFYGRIPLLIYDPTHQLPAEYPGLASQVDVAPTILHLLGLNGANAFEGNSLFEDRSRITGVLSMHESLFFTLQQSNAGPVRDTFGRDDFKGACEAADQRPSDRLTRCDYLQWHRWKAAVHAQNRVWP